MRITAKTDVGMMRSNNQDSYSAGELSGGVAWAVVCDGMGGAAGGNIASTVAVKKISQSIDEGYRNGMKPSSIRNMLESAIYSANACLYDMSVNDNELAGMGTTCVAALVVGDTAYISNIGDSRAYVISSDKKLRQITRDHSMVQDLVENGSITEDEARTFPGKNIITRALGVEENVTADYYEEALKENDILLICTDGLTNFVTHDDILRLTSDGKYFEYAERLVNLANENGGGDNITVVTIAS